MSFAPLLAERLPELVPSAFGRDTTAVSPAALVLREVYTPPLEGSAWRNGEPSAGAQIRQRAFAPPDGPPRDRSSRPLP